MDVTSVYALLHNIVIRLPSQRWMPRRSHMAKNTSRLSDLDEVDVKSMSCPKQLCVRYKSSIRSKIDIVIVVVHNWFKSLKHSC